MKFFNDLFNNFGRPQMPTKPTRELENLHWTIQNNRPFVLPSDNPDTYITEGWDRLPNVYSIISLVIEKVSTIPFTLYSVEDQRALRAYNCHMRNKNFVGAAKLRSKAFSEIESHPILDLLETPNEYQNYEDLVEQLCGYLMLTGNTYLNTEVPGAGVNAAIPQELHVLPSPLVRIQPSEKFGVAAGYQVGMYNNDIIPADQIAHLKYFNPITSGETFESMLYGDSPLKACRALLGKYAQADISQGAMFKNQGPAGVLFDRQGSELSQEQMQAAKDKIDRFHKGEKNAGGIIFTSADLGWLSIGLSPVDLNILDAKDEMLTELCNVYKVPKELFSNDEAKYSNKEQGRKQLISDAVIPMAEKVKNAFNRFLVPKFGGGVYMEMDYSVFPEIQEDLAEKQKWVSELWELTPNERRELLQQGRREDPALDKIYVPRTLVALEDLGIESFNVNPDEI